MHHLRCTTSGARMGLPRSVLVGVAVVLAGIGARVAWPRKLVDPLTLIRPQTVYAELREGVDLSVRSTSALTRPEPGTAVRMAFWTQPTYGGPLDERTIERIVSADQAESLEFRLRPAERAELRAAMKTTDDALRDLGLVIAAQEEGVKAKLRGNPERTIVLREQPAERDPRYAEVARLRKEVKYDKGAIWPDGCPEGTIYFIIYWSEFPGLKALLDDRFTLLNHRRESVRRTIVDLHRQRGKVIFE